MITPKMFSVRTGVISRRLIPRCLTHVHRYGDFSIPTPVQIRLQHGSSDGSKSLSPLLIHSLFPTCYSCGIKLQEEDASKEGYYIAPKAQTSNETPTRKKKEDEVYAKYLSELSDEDKQLLNLEEGGPTSYKNRPKRTSTPTKFECLRCRNVKYQSKYNEKDLKETFPVESVESIINGIPPDGQLIYVLNAQDFPMSLDNQVFKYRSAQEMKFLINKTDLLFPNVNIAGKYGLTFFRDYLWRKYRVAPERVEITSGLKDWNVSKLTNFFGKESYLIGYVNTGKSTIIQSMLYDLNVKKLEMRKGNKHKRDMEKLEDIRINNGELFAPRPKHQKRRQLEEYKSRNGPGSSHMPGFTRGLIPYEINDKITVYDVPGFTKYQGDGHGIFHLVDPAQIKNLTKGRNTYQRGAYDSKYFTIRSGQAMTLGGLFVLQAPSIESNTMIQVRNCINFDTHVFSSMDKFHSVAATIDNNPSMAKKFVIKRDLVGKIKYQKYLIPPFHGSIDLVIRNLGYLNLKATGSKRSDEPPLAIYIPAELDVIIRQPITKYIQKTFSGRDSKGNPLRKENYVSKSTFELQRYTGTQPFHSRLIPCRTDETQEYLQTAVSYIERAKGKVSDDDVKNWIEL